MSKLKSRYNNKTYGIITALDFKQPKTKFLYYLILTFVVFVCLICVVPIIWLFVSCLKDIDEFLAVPPTFWPKAMHPEKISGLRVMK